MLFEQYVFKLLENSKISSVEGFEVCHHKPQKYLAKRTDQNNKPVFLLEPDITLSKDGNVKVILDAKYKNPVNDSNVSVLQSDIYQMLVYATAYHCPTVYLVYPAFISNAIMDNELAQYYINTLGCNVSIKVIQLDIIDTTRRNSESVGEYNRCFLISS